jgi:MFS family permease
MENRGKLLWASFLTLIAAGVGFSVRAGILDDWSGQFGFTRTELGQITGGGLVGFGVVILLASLVVDRIGYKRMLMIAFVLHFVSAVMTLSATPVFAAVGKDSTYWLLFVAMFVFAVANGLCEAVINPLVATVYPEQKTHYLNILHAGWPGGLIVGGLFAACFSGGSPLITPLRWEIPMLLFLVPTIWYGIIVLKEVFPMSEARAAGVKLGEMFAQFASPILLLLLLLQAMVGWVELGTDSWIANITETLVTFKGGGLILFVYASMIMFVLRFFAGPIVERINPLGLLCVSTVLGTVGLVMLGTVQTTMMVIVAVTVYGFGKTFLWPTMLGVVGERFPRGGALTMGSVGGIGMLSAGLLGAPAIGYKQDKFASERLQDLSPSTYERYQAADPNKPFPFIPAVRGLDGQRRDVVLADPPGANLEADVALKQELGEPLPAGLAARHEWWLAEGAPNAEMDRPLVEEANIYGGQTALLYTAIVPAIMFLCYLGLVGYFVSKGGYKAEHLANPRPHIDADLDESGEQYTGGVEGPVR